MDDELEGFKQKIDLLELAGTYGYEVDRKASCRTSLVMRNHGQQDHCSDRRGWTRHIF